MCTVSDSSGGSTIPPSASSTGTGNTWDGTGFARDAAIIWRTGGVGYFRLPYGGRTSGISAGAKEIQLKKYKKYE